MVDGQQSYGVGLGVLGGSDGVDEKDGVEGY